MFDTKTPSQMTLNFAEYQDKVLGCWTGKNIGGTLGAPFEGDRGMNAVSFYAQDLGGEPVPNDDLDLQLVWLQAAEENGLYHLTPRLLGEYWMNGVANPSGEYSVCKANIANGLYPPLSGSCNNDAKKFSNGAWIRSEIWACLFPGSPDEAAEFAYFDSCCDHCGEGIHAEVFTASLQAAAFVVSDVRRLIEIGLSKIPQDCRVARAVKVACQLFDQGSVFQDARNAVVKDSEDLGWFQAPGNLGFAILGLLYGGGDFGKSVCLATNCGDDTDCTAATVGALLGIISGRSGIPQKWIEPIGETIKTVSLHPFDLEIPKTLGALTERVVKLALAARRENPLLLRIAPEPTAVAENYLTGLAGGEAVEKRVWNKSPYELVLDLPYAELAVDYEDGPFIVPGEAKRLTLSVRNTRFSEQVVHVDFKLPEGWRALPAAGVSLNCIRFCSTKTSVTLIPGATSDIFSHVPLEVRLAGRFNPTPLYLPFQLKGAAKHESEGHFQPALDEKDRRLARANAPMDR